MTPLTQPQGLGQTKHVNRRQPLAVTAEGGYEKVLEVHTLNILLALGKWAYARQFLGYVRD